MTVMVPLGSFAFALPFMPEATAVKGTDVAGLFVILSGLVLYRFGQQLLARWRGESAEGRNSLTAPLNGDGSE